MTDQDLATQMAPMDQAIAVIRELDGEDTGLRLKLNLSFSKWNPNYVDRDEDPPKMDLYILLFKKMLKKQVAKLNLGDASILRKPVQPANDKIETLVRLGGRLECSSRHGGRAAGSVAVDRLRISAR